MSISLPATEEPVILSRKSLQVVYQKDGFDDLSAVREVLADNNDLLYTINSTKEFNPVYIGQRPGVIVIVGNRRMHIYGDSTQVDAARNEILMAVDEKRAAMSFPSSKAYGISQKDIDALNGIEKETLDSLVLVAESNKFMPLRHAIKKVVEG